MNAIMLIILFVVVGGFIWMGKESTKFKNACDKIDKAIDETSSVKELERIREYEIGSLSKLVIYHTQYSEVHRLVEKCLKKSNNLLLNNKLV